MKIGMVGLGKMGANMVRRLANGGHDVVGFDLSPEVVTGLAQEVGMIPIESIELLVGELDPPRAVWVMVPSGEVTDSVLVGLSELMQSGDVVIDGGNSNFRETLRRAKFLAERGIHLIDVGTSGGVWGVSEGYSMMVGGDEQVVACLRPIFETLAPASDRGWGRVGPSGAGHFVKMVHNGIEYGMMAAFAEGFELMRAAKEFELNLYEVAEIWRYGSVVRSWLLDLTAAALQQDPELANIDDWVADSGEGRWTVVEAINYDVPLPVITQALFQRFRSRQESSYAAKLLASMRNQFGGHAMRYLEEKGITEVSEDHGEEIGKG